jgi:hypothetical protein
MPRNSRENTSMIRACFAGGGRRWVEYNGDRVFIEAAIPAATTGVTGILTEFDS